MESLLPCDAETAAHLATYLAGDAQRTTVTVGDKHRLDILI